MALDLLCLSNSDLEHRRATPPATLRRLGHAFRPRQMIGHGIDKNTRSSTNTLNTNVDDIVIGHLRASLESAWRAFECAYTFESEEHEYHALQLIHVLSATLNEVQENKL